MAINKTNANFVNISNLPQTQQAVDTDLIILQTENGTRTITFENFNVVRTDAAGNATVLGNLTGNDAILDNALFYQSVSSVSFSSQGRLGDNKANGFYNRFTINGGLVTSATYITNSSPDYINITKTFLPNLTGWTNTIYKVFIDDLVSVTIPNGQNNTTGQFDNVFTRFPDVDVNNLLGYVTVAGQGSTTERISSFPWVGSLVNDGFGNLDFRVYLGYNTPRDVNLLIRLNYPLKPTEYPF